MPAAVTLAVSIIGSLLPLVKAGTQAYADIKAVRDAINAAHAEGRDLTTDEFAAFMAKADAAGAELAALAAAAEAEITNQGAQA